MEGNVLAFSSGHIIRMIAARWNGLAPSPEPDLFLASRKRSAPNPRIASSLATPSGSTSAPGRAGMLSIRVLTGGYLLQNLDELGILL
jgi:hypothetical protein